MRYSHNSHDSKSARANTEALEELTEIDNPLYSCRPPDGTNKWNDVAWNGQIETTLSVKSAFQPPIDIYSILTGALDRRAA